MRVRLQTSVVGILGRGLLLLLIGGGLALWADHHGWLDLPAVTSGAVPAQTPAPAQEGTASPVTAPPQATRSAPPGSVNFLGINIPPPGSNDPN